MTTILRTIILLLLLLFAAYATHTAELKVEQHKLSKMTEKKL